MNQQQKTAQLREQRNGNGNGNGNGDAASATAPDAAAMDSLATATRWAIIGIAVVMAIGVLYVARSILMPVLAAFLVGSTLSPLQKYAEQYRIPRGASAAVLMLVFVMLLGLAMWLVANPVAAWIAEAPDLGQLVKEKLRWLDGPLATIKELQQAISGSDGAASKGDDGLGVQTNLTAIGQQVVMILTPALSEFLVFLGTLLFYLVGHNRLRRHIVTTFGTRDARLRVVRIWSDIESNLVGYISTVTVINIGLGIATTLLTWALGFPSPIVWGVLAFVLNYIPYLGPAMVVLMMFLAGLIISPTFSGALVMPALFVTMTTIEGHALTPSIVGRRFTVSPLLVFLSLAFWTWLWGAFGAFLAVPFLIVGQVLISHLMPRDEVTLPG